jgi:hypothetical protein
MADGVTVAYSPLPVAKVVVLAIVLLMLQTVVADEVIMRNGDRLTGEVLRQDAQVLKLKTAYAGTLTIDWTEVREIKLDEPRKVLMDNETVVRVSTFSRDANRLILRESPGSEPLTVDVSRVMVIEPEPWELDEGYKLGGQVNVALKSERGNTHKNEIDFDYQLDYRRRWHRLESYGELEYDTRSGDRTTDKWSMLNKYSRLFRGPWYAGGWLFFKHDRFAGQRLRTIVATDNGVQVL